IVGVVKDFNFNSLRQRVTPLALFFGEEKGSVAIRLKTSDLPSLITQVENKWKSVVPGQPFNCSFMNDDFDKIYRSEQRIGKIAMSFSVLAIFIACLGLFGLVTYAAEQRTKEIGIRKVLGATVTNIVGILSKDFLKLVIIAALIAFPIAWWAMSTWLQNFAYRINISWWIFLLAIGIALFIALATISFQAIKAAVANPVKNLRTE
ncbi:MAG: ABC transporter permease, partial [Chitinophagaceae bacterium]